VEIIRRARMGFSLPDDAEELLLHFIGGRDGTEKQAAEIVLEYKRSDDIKIRNALEKKFLALHEKIIEVTPSPHDIIVLLSQPDKRNKAIECIVRLFMNENYVFTTMHDEKPEMWIYQDGIYIPHGRAKIKEFTRGVLGELYTTQIVNQVISRIEADTYINMNEFYNSEYEDIIPVLNGLLYVRGEELKEFNPGMIFFSKIPVFYDSKKKCPNIISHFRMVLQSSDDVEVMQEWLGNLLLKNYRYQKAVMMNGEGSNGKGITIELMKRFLGADNCVSKTLQDLADNEWAVGCLFKKMANLAGDIDRIAMKKTAIFKSITSGTDMISAKRKFLPDIDFVNYAKCVFSSNELPMTYDTTDGYMRRWIFFEFVYSFVEKEKFERLNNDERKFVRVADKKIFNKLITPDELSGLLNWALEGLWRIEKRGYIKDNRTTEEVRKLWVQKTNSFASFFNDFCALDWDSYIIKQDLHKEYIEYCRKHALKPATPKMIKFFLNDEGIDEEYKRFENEERKWIWNGLKSNYNNIVTVNPVNPVRGIPTYTEKSFFGVKGEIGSPPSPPSPPKPNEQLKQLIDSYGKGPFHMDFFTSTLNVNHNVILRCKEKGLLMESKPNWFEVL